MFPVSVQIIHEWKDISSIHIDSFLDNGEDHLLLLHKPSDTTTSLKSFPEFIMTDMGLNLITSDLLLPDGKGQEKVKGQTPGHCPKNLITTVHALERRVKVRYNTVEPRYNEDLGTMKITLLYQVSHYIRVKTQRNIKSWDQQNHLVIRGFCYIRPLYNEVPLYIIYISAVHR